MKTYKSEIHKKLCFYVVKIKEYEKRKTKNLRYEISRKHYGDFNFKS